MLRTLSILIAVALIGFGVYDFFLKDRLALYMNRSSEQTQTTGSGQLMSSDGVLSSSLTDVVTKNPVHPDIKTVLKDAGIDASSTEEKSVLMTLLPSSTPTETLLLTQENDRVGLIAYIESDKSKELFADLKKQLLAKISKSASDTVVDTTLMPKESAPADVLWFKDPAIAEEQILLLRVKNRIYCLQIQDSKEEAVRALVEKL